MSSQAKIVIPVIVLLAGYVIFLLLPSDDLGSFTTVQASGEINQTIKVGVVAERGFDRNAIGQITSFYAKDKYGTEAHVSLGEPAPAELATAKVVDLFGHMHGSNFIGKRVEIIE